MVENKKKPGKLLNELVETQVRPEDISLAKEKSVKKIKTTVEGSIKEE